jgi:hypothetical protein
MDPTAATALVDDAAKKSGLVWVGAPGERGQPVWHVWADGTFYVLTGGLEQPAPAGLDRGRAVVCVRSKDRRSRVATVAADARVVAAGSPEWDAVEPTLLSKRLNLPDGDAAAGRWRRECTLWALTPTGEVFDSADEPSTGAHAAPPPPTPARSRVPRPWHLFGRPARNRRRLTD